MSNKRGVLQYVGPAAYGCLLYRHRERRKNFALQLADESDAQQYADRHSLVVIPKEEGEEV